MVISAGPGCPYSPFDKLSHGLAVFRERRVAYVNEALLRLLGRSASEVLGRPPADFVTAPLAADVWERHVARERGEAVPETYETSLRTTRGERRVELTISRNGPDTVVLVRDVTARAQHRAALQRLAEVGSALPSARTGEEVLQRLFSGLAEVGLTFAWLRPEGERVHLEHVHLSAELTTDARVVAAIDGLERVGAWTPRMAQLWREGAAHGDDLALEVSRYVAPARAEAVRTALRNSGPVSFIGVRIDEEGAPRAMLMVCASWLREEELAPLRLVGAQVSAALEAAHTISRLSAQNTALAALNRLAFSATTATEPRALFEAGAEEITRLLGCDAFGVLLWTEGQQTLELAYSRGLDPAVATYLRGMPRRGSISDEVLQDGRVRVLDIEQCPPFTREGMRRMGLATIVVVPLQVRSLMRGTLVVAFRERRALSTLECETLQSLGTHFSATSEAHRLLREVRGRAEHLDLIHEVGRSLVGTLELGRLTELGAAALARIVDVSDAYVLLLEPGDRLVIRAAVGRHPELNGYYIPTEPPEATLSGRALRARTILQVEDARVDPDISDDIRRRAEGIAFLVLPLIVHGHPVGVALLSDPRQPRRFTEAEVERASAIANQLALALDGARLVEDLKKRNAELARAHAQLVQRERLAALGELAAVVAHEVRNPLGAIFNSVATLRRMVGEDSPTLPLLHIVGEEAERLNRIVDDLLNFARPTSPSPQPAALERLLEEAVRGALADATGPVDVEWVLEEGVRPVSVDERMMRQAFLNLALNAVQAMPNGGVLRVGVRLAVAERPGVEVEFTDTGPGIPPEARARLFEPFFTTKAKGTGLGLALVRRIVESHDGKLTLESPTRGGTTFRIFLPREPEPSAPKPLAGS